jgi:uncharacterized protein YbjT (DUF2867 family)
MILVIGGTGTVGGALQRKLADRGTHARFLVRTVARANEVTSRGFAAAIDYFANLANLDAALAGVERLFLLTPVSPDDQEIKTAIIDPAEGAGVRHVVLLSGAGGDPNSPNSQC